MSTFKIGDAKSMNGVVDVEKLYTPVFGDMCYYHTIGTCTKKDCKFKHPKICPLLDTCKCGLRCEFKHPQVAHPPGVIADCFFKARFGECTIKGCPHNHECVLSEKCRNCTRGEECVFPPYTLKFSPPVSPSIKRNSSNNICSVLAPPDGKKSPDVEKSLNVMGSEMSPFDIDLNTKFDWKGKNGHKKILIIGGAGHGKSTFINSLHNYFNKKTLYEMEAVIPTKYLQPIEDSPCDTENPNPMNSTDSVTQRCTEYTFTKPFSRNTSVTFIDTPGLTDGTRCSAQDKINMIQIMKYISETEHDEPITGIIMIMKGNQVKDISSMQTMAQKLKTNSMTQNIIDNIVTVFTNCRFKSICRAHSHIPFDIKENNSFYIDNPVFSVDVASGLIDDAEKRAYEELYDETLIKIVLPLFLVLPLLLLELLPIELLPLLLTVLLLLLELQPKRRINKRMISPTTVVTPPPSPPPPPPSSWLSDETVKKDHMKLPEKDLKNNDKTVTMDNNNHHLGELFKHLTTKTFISFQRAMIQVSNECNLDPILVPV
eukprot:gene6122-12394_t